MKKNKITLILCTILTVLLIGIITFAIIGGNESANKEVFYEVKLTGSYYEDDKGLLKDEFDYEKLVDKYDFKDESLKLDFTKKDYIYYLFNYAPCSEKITYKGLKYKDETAIINIDVQTNCDFCKLEYMLLIYEVDKDKAKKVDINLDVHELEECEYEIDKKPILYLYPTSKTNITVKLKYNDRILTSYPKYEDGWFVEAHPNGDLYDLDNKYYYALYWDEVNKTEVDFSEGFYVTKDNAISFLEEKLSLIGLNGKEKNEFIMYWLPVLENNEQSLVYFELTEERQNNNELIIKPKPDSLLRVNIHIKKVYKKVSIPEQQLTTFERVGFVAVEWGGTIH